MNYLTPKPYSAELAAGDLLRSEWVMRAAPIRGKIR